jgi:hypothetical protein
MAGPEVRAEIVQRFGGFVAKYMGDGEQFFLPHQRAASPIPFGLRYWWRNSVEKG